MSKNRLEMKVGLFVFAGLILFAGLVLKFSKGSSAFTPTYKLNLEAENVGGIIPGAAVQMAGVPIGNVTDIDLDEAGRHVVIRVKLLKRFRIYSDAVFGIKQAGFLGDRFIAVFPTKNQGHVLQDGEKVRCEEAFDLTEVARSTSGLLKRVDQTVQQLNTAVARIDRTLLAAETLTNLTATINNFRLLSERSLSTVDDIDRFVKANTSGLSGSISNFGNFSVQLNRVTGDLRETILTNRLELTAALKNLESSTAKINELLADVQSGKGLAGNLLKNEELAQNVSLMVSNLNVLSSNINNKGLWSAFRKPKTSKK